MRHGKPWLAGGRQERLAMGRLWVRVLTLKASEWNMSSDITDELMVLVTEAGSALLKVMDKAGRTHGDVVHCAAAFKAMVKKMRFIKNNYFQSPPRTEEELEMLDLHARKIAEVIDAPRNEVREWTKALDDHLLEVFLKINEVKGQDRPESDHGAKLFAAIVDPAKAGTEGRYGKYLAAAPESGLDFSWSMFTQTSTVTFDFDVRDRGKTVWFIAHLGTASGKIGPWGPMFSTIIP
jgi:hypothetical protein